MSGGGPFASKDNSCDSLLQSLLCSVSFHGLINPPYASWFSILAIVSSCRLFKMLGWSDSNGSSIAFTLLRSKEHLLPVSLHHHVHRYPSLPSACSPDGQPLLEERMARAWKVVGPGRT